MAEPGASRLPTLTVGLFAATCLLGMILAGGLLPPSLWPAALLHPDAHDIAQLLVRDSLLPRATAALVCGGALALAGALLQQVLRNPLAEPGTLAVAAGSQLALALAALFAPWTMAFGREAVALVGGGLAIAAVFVLSRGSGLAPLSVTLAGLVVGFYCASISAMLILFNEHDLAGLFIWGSGSLSLQDWSPVLRLLLPLLLAGLAGAALVRPLALLELGDGAAKSLGLPLVGIRLAILAIAVALTASVVSTFGVIGFVGLGGPTLARLAGARRPAQQLVWAAPIGAGLLGITDALVQLFSPDGAIIPTGAVTALIGAPLLLLLLPRLPVSTRPPVAASEDSVRHGAGRMIGALALLLACLLVPAIACGRGAQGWTFDLGAGLAELAPWRLPRVFGAGVAGAMLGTAGVILQRLLGNPMASPEILGLSAGAIFGSASILFLADLASPIALAAGGFGGACLVLVALLLLVGYAGHVSERILIAGLAMTAVLDAAIAGLMATGDPRAILLLGWMSGSTYRMDGTAAAWSAAAALLLLPGAFALSRWLDVLPLGPATARALGMPVTQARLVMLALAGALAAAGTLVTGPLSFVGLMAPHLARRSGLTRALPHLAGAALLGAGIMVLADWLGRVAHVPWQMPAGLVATLVGGPLLMVLLARSHR